MRIGVDLAAIQGPSRGRGIGRYARGLIATLAGFGFELVGLARCGERIEGWPAQHPLHWLPEIAPDPTRWDNPTLDAAIQGGHLDNLNLDAILLTNPQESSVEPVRIPVVAVHYDCCPERCQLWHGPNGPVEIYWAAYRRYLARYPRYDQVWTLSQSARADLLELHPEVPADRVHVIGAGLDTTFWRPDDCGRDWPALSLLQLAPGMRWIVGVGGYDARKGCFALVDAYARLPSELRERYRLVCAFGSTDDHSDALMARAYEHKLANVHVVTGKLDDTTLRAVMRQASCVAYLSSYEGFGLPILEAAGVGTPVVCGNNSSQPEVLCGNGVAVDVSSPAAIAHGLATVLTSDPGRWVTAQDRAIATHSWRHVGFRARRLLARDRHEQVA